MERIASNFTTSHDNLSSASEVLKNFTSFKFLKRLFFENFSSTTRREVCKTNSFKIFRSIIVMLHVTKGKLLTTEMNRIS